MQRVLNPGTQHSKTPWTWSFLDAHDKPTPYYIPEGEGDTTLMFESRFESGNLGLAVKLSNTEYNLVLQNDSLTRGNTQCTADLQAE
jgi:hypothetical protein